MDRKEVAISNEDFIQSDAAERKIKLEAYLTAGCGYGRKKKRLLNRFWKIVWPGLEEAGWKKVGRDLRCYFVFTKHIYAGSTKELLFITFSVGYCFGLLARKGMLAAAVVAAGLFV